MDETLKKYTHSRILHLHLSEAYAEVGNIYRMEGLERVVLIVGATGVGKSVLLARLYRECHQEFLEEMRVDPGFVPAILQTMPSPTPKNSRQEGFDWTDAFTRLLHAGHDILIEKKVMPHVQIELDGKTVNGTGGLLVRELRRAMEQFAVSRQCR